MWVNVMPMEAWVTTGSRTWPKRVIGSSSRSGTGQSPWCIFVPRQVIPEQVGGCASAGGGADARRGRQDRRRGTRHPRFLRRRPPRSRSQRRESLRPRRAGPAEPRRPPVPRRRSRTRGSWCSARTGLSAPAGASQRPGCGHPGPRPLRRAEFRAQRLERVADDPRRSRRAGRRADCARHAASPRLSRPCSGACPTPSSTNYSGRPVLVVPRAASMLVVPRAASE
jgi:hypothetical protein